MFSGFGNTPTTTTSGFGGFGSGQSQTQQPQQQQAPGSMFGGLATTQSNTAQPNATGGSLFGNTAGQAPGLFGNTTGQQQQPQQPANSLFGNTQQTQPAATSGGLFGNAAQQNTAGGLFSNAAAQQNTNATGAGLFSNNQAQGTTGGGLFGNTAASGTTGGGLFGNNNNASTTTGGSLFGSTAAANTGGSLFGSTTAAPSTTGTSLFGGMTSATNNAPAGNLFGTQTNQPSQTSLFGQQRQAGSLFGQPGQQPQTQQQTTNSLFGSSLQQSQMQPQSTLFGSTTAQPSGGLFGSTLGIPSWDSSALANSVLFSRATVVPTQQQTDPQSQFLALVQRIDAVKQAWDSASPQCRFQHYLYNLVEPSKGQFYGRPPNATNEALWTKAVRENPDPTCLVPVLAVGLDDLQQRVDAQTKQAAEHSERLKELKTRIEALSQRHEVTNTARLRRATALQMQLSHRVLKVVQHLHLFIPALRSSSIRPEEEALRAALEDIDEDIRRPGGMSKMRGKLNEMWALVDAVRAARERNRSEGQVEWAVVDEDGLGHISQILAEEQAGLAYVTTILQRALKDLAVIQGVQPKEEDTDMLAGSANALRDSLMR